MVYQEEVGEEGTHHLQGYLEFPKPVRRAHIAKTLDGAFIEKAKGTPDECDAYCTKVDTRVGEPCRFGVRSSQGKRCDLLALRDAVRAGKRGRDLFEDDGVCSAAIKYPRGVDKLGEAYDPPVSREDVHVTLHYGPPGMISSFFFL